MSEHHMTTLQAGELFNVRGHVYRVAGFNAYGQAMLEEISWPTDAERAGTAPLVTSAQLDSSEGRAAYARYLVSVGREAEIPYLVGESVRLEAGLGPIREAVDSADELPIEMPWHLLRESVESE